MTPQKNGETILQGTGLLVLTSSPDGAKVYINDDLNTATNNTINLSPGIYSIRIEKEGYISWKKQVEVQEEVVTVANAFLIPQAPKLESMTLTGAENPLLDPTGSFIAYTVSSASAARNGLYVLDMSRNPIIPIGGFSAQIADETGDVFSSARLSFSPDGKELLATVSAAFLKNTYRFSTTGGLQRPVNVNTTLPIINQQWQAADKKLFAERMRSLKKPVAQFVSTYFKNPVFSPKQDKVLYEASQSATLPVVIKPRLLGGNTTAENREIKQGGMYVYDIKEDRNFPVYTAENGNASPTIVWWPDSAHLLFIENKKIYVMEYDAGNKTIVYAGPFWDSFVAPWPDGSRIVILTNLNSPDIPLNLYTVSLK